MKLVVPSSAAGAQPVAAGLPILPVRSVTPTGKMVLSFGPPFVPQIPPEQEARDSAVAQQVMDAIARHLAG